MYPAWLPPAFTGTCTPQAPLAPLTTLRIGGAAEWLVEVNTLAELRLLLVHKPLSLPLTLLGEGSNILIADSGIKGVVLRLRGELTDVSVHGQTLTAAAGATCGKAARAAREAELTGLEFFAGIPGSIGGALTMNAGAYGHETQQCLTHAQAMLPDGTLQTFSPTQLGMAYRTCLPPRGAIFTQAVFTLQSGDKTEIRERMRKINHDRAQSQPLEYPSSGSWFKNPLLPDGSVGKAWQVVDAAGCRGLRVGDAQVSEKHANFFINLGKATAAEMLTLSHQVAIAVKQKSGLDMHLEVKQVGFDT
jgi:UDP-N-acetylmuramate dehydrogenase